MILVPTVRAIDASWRTDASDLTETYGAKAVGLARLPIAWVPPTLAISVNLCRSARGCEDENAVQIALRAVWSSIQNWATENSILGPVVLRSSASHETILDRGKYLSLEIPSLNFNGLVEAATKILRHFFATGTKGEMGLLLQPLKSPKVKGHVANIRRVSKTRNQWEYEVFEHTSFSVDLEGRFNSQRANIPDVTTGLPPVHSEEDLISTLRQIGKWITNEVQPVVSIEWVADSAGFWLVQCDDEGAPPDAIDPRKLTFPGPSTCLSKAPPPFKLYDVGNPTEIRKLSLLSDFSPPGFTTSHAINYANGAELQTALQNDFLRAQIANAIDEYGPNGVVVRTALIGQSGGKTMNLPRTDTVGGQTAVNWIEERIIEFGEQGCHPEKVAFLMHRFVVARKAAWSYCAPGERKVRIDALWGLPDGIQFYPCDNHEFDLVTGRDERPTIQFKPYVLWPDQNGVWAKQSVHPLHARRQCLSNSEIEQISRHAEAITNKLGTPTQIMWFCDFPPESEHTAPLPWYRDEQASRPSNQAAAPLLPRKRIKRKEDLEALLMERPPTRYRLILEPEPSAIRDPDFIKLVAQCANDGRHAVVLEGSALAHAFYQLTDSGVAVYSLRGTGRQRIVRKREFGKLVRDKIPEIVAATGETATYGRVPTQVRKRLLISKAVEELWELSRAVGPAQVEEIADLFEVFTALLKEFNVTWEDVAQEAEKKRVKRGGFDKGYVLVQTSLPREQQPTLLPATDARSVHVSARAALEAASAIEVQGQLVSFSFFSLLEGEAIATVSAAKGTEPFTLTGWLNGDRLLVELSGPQEKSRDPKSG